MSVPLSVGGWGAREGVTAWAFGAAGLGAAQGVATATVYGVLAFAATLPGAAVLVVGWLRDASARRASSRRASSCGVREQASGDRFPTGCPAESRPPLPVSAHG